MSDEPPRTAKEIRQELLRMDVALPSSKATRSELEALWRQHRPARPNVSGSASAPAAKSGPQRKACGAATGLAIAALAAGWGYLSRLSPVSGTTPLLHLGIPRGFDEASLPDLSSKVVLITGANVGLGRGTARVLARANAQVIVSARSEAKCAGAVAGIKAASGPRASVDCLPLELSSLASVKRFCEAVRPKLQALGGLHALVLNAGVMFPPYMLTEEGIEWQFGVNHVAHFLIARELQGLLVASAPSACVAVSSLAHEWPKPAGGVLLELDAINDAAMYSPHAWYAQSKLANLLFSQELDARLHAKGVSANAVNPGAVQGELLRWSKAAASSRAAPLSPLFDAVERALLAFYWPEEVGGLSVAYAALAGPMLGHAGSHGKYFVPVAREWPASTLDGHARNVTLQRGLWSFTEELLASKGFGVD